MTTRHSAKVDALWRVACVLARRSRLRHPTGRRLPPLLFFTDPDRTPDPVATAERLPRGAGVVFRHFGRADAEAVAGIMAEVARRRGLTLLIGDDERLAAKVGAAGVHLPERRLNEAASLRRRRPTWLITAAAHGEAALVQAERNGAHAAVLSPAFQSRSPSAGPALGPVRLARLVRGSALPVYALGGVGPGTVRRLLSTGVIGVAAVAGLAPAH